MTPLKPVETDRIRGVPSARYPLNTVCSFPGCKRKDVTAHHIFGTIEGKWGRSWWVEVEKFSPYDLVDYPSKIAIPAVTGACGHGTEGHHGDYEAHRLWIRYEDGVFNVYQRIDPEPEGEIRVVDWELVGPLDPQPPNTEKRRGRAPNKKGPEARERKTISFHVPKDAEGQEIAGQIDDNIEWAEAKMFPKEDERRSPAWTLVDLTHFGVLWLKDEEIKKNGG